MRASLNIEDYQKKPLPFSIYEDGRRFYVSISSLIFKIRDFLLLIVAVVTFPIWMTIIYFLLVRSWKKARKGFEAMITEWNDAPISAEMFDTLENIMRFKQIMERDNGKFHMPKRFRLFRPFFWEIGKFYNVYDEQAKWIEQKLYPTAEVLGIPQEDIEFMKSQMTEEDYKDLRDPDWISFEKECVLGN